MSRSQRQLTILIALIGIMIAVYANMLRPSPSSGALSPKAVQMGREKASTGEIETAAAPSPDRMIRRQAQRNYSASLPWSRDPFGRGSAEGALNGFTLSGILWDSTQPIAIINGQPLRIGEEVDGYRIVEIAQDRVSLTDGTQTHQLLITP
jgi:hypothetical protein